MATVEFSEEARHVLLEADERWVNDGLMSTASSQRTRSSTRSNMRPSYSPTSRDSASCTAARRGIGPSFVDSCFQPAGTCTTASMRSPAASRSSRCGSPLEVTARCCSFEQARGQPPARLPQAPASAPRWRSTRRCSTPKTGTACAPAPWSAKTAASTWSPSPSGAARRWACTSAATPKSKSPCARRARRPPRPGRLRGRRDLPDLLHPARLGRGPGDLHPRLPLRALHREGSGDPIV